MSLCCAPLPIFTGQGYKNWRQVMKIFLISQDLWDVIETSNTQEKRNAQALYYILRAVAPTILPEIISQSSANIAWGILEAAYAFNFVDDKGFHSDEIQEEVQVVDTSSWPKDFIFEVPRPLRDLNPTAYTPQLVSIGPLHYGKPQLANMEKHKLYYAKHFLGRTGKQKKFFVHFIKQREKSIRDCYCKRSQLKSNEYVEMILVDSFFIFNFSINLRNYFADEEYLPLRHSWKKIWLDLMLVENQLPFFFLSELYEITGCCSWDSQDLHGLAHLYVYRVEGQLAKGKIKDMLHFTSLRRGFECSGAPVQKNIHYIPPLKFSAKKLSESKVTIYGNACTEISFKNRKLILPRFKIDDSTETIYCNLIVLELTNFRDEAFICRYIMLLRWLIETSDDVAVLINSDVIHNELGSNQAVVDMFNKFEKTINGTFRYCFYDVPFLSVCKELNAYGSSWRGWWSYYKRMLKDVYFTNIWTGTGTVAAVILLLLTLTQTVTSILQLR